MRLYLLTILGLSLLLLPNEVLAIDGHNHAHDDEVVFKDGYSNGGEVIFEGVWARPTAKLSQAGVIYAKVTNNSAKDDAIIRVSSPAARSVKLHISKMNRSGIMTMKHMHTLELPAGKTVNLTAGGQHIMLIGLARQLEDGDEIPLRVQFRNSPQQNIKVVIKDPRKHKNMHSLKIKHSRHKGSHEAHVDGDDHEMHK